MDIKELGSTMIHKYIRNPEEQLILPTKAIMRINKKFLSNKKKDKINIKKYGSAKANSVFVI